MDDKRDIVDLDNQTPEQEGAQPGAVTAANEAEITSPSSIPPDELERLTDDLVAAFKSVFDPEIPVDIYELGLIYKADISDERDVVVDMTLTAPGCPVAGEMPIWVENAVRSVPGVRDVKVNMVFDPPWGPDRMSEVARVELNWF